jgi:hypothetical protein
LFDLRDAAAPWYLDLRRAVIGAGAIITSSGPFRELIAAVTPGRSATPFHYSGLALDLSATSGMRDPRVDPFILTADGDLWRVWARSDQGLEQRLDAVVVWADGATRTQTDRQTDGRGARAGLHGAGGASRVSAHHGFRRIRRR